MGRRSSRQYLRRQRKLHYRCQLESSLNHPMCLPGRLASCMRHLRDPSRAPLPPSLTPGTAPMRSRSTARRRRWAFRAARSRRAQSGSCRWRVRARRWPRRRRSSCTRRPPRRTRSRRPTRPRPASRRGRRPCPPGPPSASPRACSRPRPRRRPRRSGTRRRPRRRSCRWSLGQTQTRRRTGSRLA